MHLEEEHYSYKRNRLFNLLKETNITKEDIVTIYGNPYLTTISNWNNISTNDKNNIRKEYPEMDNLAKAYEERKKDWGDTVIKVLNGTTEVLDTIKRVLDNPIIDWCIVATAVATSITCPPLGGVAVPACTAVITRRAATRLAPTAGLLLTREIGREIGKDATELQHQFNTLYSKKYNNSGNSYNNKGNSNKNSNTQLKQRIQNTHEDVLNCWNKLKSECVLDKLFPYGGKHKGAKVIKDYAYKGTHGTIELKKGDYLGRDDMHREIEWFRGEKKHLGAFDPKTGQMLSNGINGRTIRK